MEAVSMGKALPVGVRNDVADMYRRASATKRMNRQIAKLKSLRYRFVLLHETTDRSLFNDDRTANVMSAAAGLAEALAAVVESRGELAPSVDVASGETCDVAAVHEDALA